MPSPLPLRPSPHYTSIPTADGQNSANAHPRSTPTPDKNSTGGNGRHLSLRPVPPVRPPAPLRLFPPHPRLPSGFPACQNQPSFPQLRLLFAPPDKPIRPQSPYGRRPKKQVRTHTHAPKTTKTRARSVCGPRAPRTDSCFHLLCGSGKHRFQCPKKAPFYPLGAFSKSGPFPLKTLLRLGQCRSG